METPNILCLPKDCQVAEKEKPVVSACVLPALLSLGFSKEEIDRIMQTAEEPHFSNIKKVICGKCANFPCPHNYASRQSLGMDTEITWGLMDILRRITRTIFRARRR